MNIECLNDNPNKPEASIAAGCKIFQAGHGEFYWEFNCLLHAPRESIYNKEIATSPLPARTAFLYVLSCIDLKGKLNVHHVIMVYPVIIMDDMEQYRTSC